MLRHALFGGRNAFMVACKRQRDLSAITCRLYSTSDDFTRAQADLKKLSEEPDTETKLKIYGLFKQATIGNVSGSRPGMMDFAGRAKFDAWKSVEGITKEDAQTKYVELVRSLGGASGEEPKDISHGSGGGQSVPGLRVTREDKVFRIQLDRPDKFNAITWEMYEGIISALNESNMDKGTTITLFTGSGDYYCSGNDLSNFTRGVNSQEDMRKMADTAEEMFHRFVAAFIDHKKPLVGLVNGPAIGISVTTLALFDMVLASDAATFHTPFTSLGQSAEGCSTYTFPTIMGPSKASELLLFGRKLTAEEALERSLISAVIPHNRFRKEAEERIVNFSKLPPQSLSINKGLLRDVHRDALHAVNKRECAVLKNRWLSAECAAALQKFMSRKK
jgi:peroxisomal 3,2-trans-enoyl-CoA isomerase